MPDVPDPAGDAGADPLRDGDLRLLGRVTTASNLTVVAETANGVRCVYKPVRGEVPLWDFPDGTLAGREVASYLISSAIGWNLIPETVLRDGPLGPGMVQRWVEHTESSAQIDLCTPGKIPDGWHPILRADNYDGEEVILVHSNDVVLHQLAVLDVVLNNADRKGGHVLDRAEGGLFGIDHGICLHAEPKLRTVLWGWSRTTIPAEWVDDLAGLDATLDGSLGEQLTEYITAAEVQALRRRVAKLVAAPLMPGPASSRPIPWPPF